MSDSPYDLNTSPCARRNRPQRKVGDDVLTPGRARLVGLLKRYSGMTAPLTSRAAALCRELVAFEQEHPDVAAWARGLADAEGEVQK